MYTLKGGYSLNQAAKMQFCTIDFEADARSIFVLIVPHDREELMFLYRIVEIKMYLVYIIC